MSIRSTPVWRALGVLAAALLIASCASGGGNRAAVGQPGFGPIDNPDRSSSPAVKVALLLPTGGPGNAAQVARAMRQAGELALFEFDDPNVALVVKDTKGTAEGAKAAAEAAVRDNAELILGPVFSQEVAAAAPVARAADIPMIAFSSDRQVAGNGVYLLSFLPGGDVPRIVSYAAGQNKRTFAALIPQSAYGKLVEEAFTRAVSQAGGQIVALERYAEDANSMLEPAQKVAEAIQSSPGPVDALFLPGGPETLPALATMIPYFDIDTDAAQLLGTGQWDYPNIGNEAPLLGAWFAAPDPSGWRSFTQRYVATYDASPPRIASLAYDAVSLAVSLSNAAPGRRYTADRVTRATGFSGIDGLFRLRPDGTAERGLAVLEVQSFGVQVRQSAPSSFSMAQY